MTLRVTYSRTEHNVHILLALLTFKKAKQMSSPHYMYRYRSMFRYKELSLLFSTLTVQIGFLFLNVYANIEIYFNR
jgi:hypothetical protein